MKRKSYCLITTAVTSIKCYLKVNGLHMLKTLELLTDHCKVSRIFNNLHVARSLAIFGTRAGCEPGLSALGLPAETTPAFLALTVKRGWRRC